MTISEPVRSVPSIIRPESKDIPVCDIKIKSNVRRDYPDIAELANDIRRNGLIQPITVYCIEGDGYIVKIGHRRFLAYHLLCTEEPERFRTIPCPVSTADNIVAVQLAEISSDPIYRQWNSTILSQHCVNRG